MPDNPYPAWRQRACAHCAEGALIGPSIPPQVNPAGVHTIAGEKREPCTAPTEAEYIAELESNLAEWEAGFDLRSKADMRAIKRWQEAHPGNDLVWPDHADLCVWLLGELDAVKMDTGTADDAHLTTEQYACNYVFCALVGSHMGSCLAEHAKAIDTAREKKR